MMKTLAHIHQHGLTVKPWFNMVQAHKSSEIILNLPPGSQPASERHLMVRLQGFRGVVQHRAAEPHRLQHHRAAAARRRACEAQGRAVVLHGLQDHVASGEDLSGRLTWGIGIPQKNMENLLLWFWMEE